MKRSKNYLIILYIITTIITIVTLNIIYSHYPVLWSLLIIPSILLLVTFPRWKPVLLGLMCLSFIKFLTVILLNNGDIPNLDILLINTLVNYIVFCTIAYFRIKEHKQSNYLEIDRQRYKSLFEFNTDSIYSLDLDGKLVDCNRILLNVFGYPDKEEIDSYEVLVDPNDLDLARQQFQMAVDGNPKTFEVNGINKNGQKINLNVTNMPIVINGKIVGVYGILKDMTKQKLAEEKIRHMAYHDLLTGLPNRLSFNNQLANAILNEKRIQSGLALVYLDLDGFKPVNDTYGHLIGDLLLKEVTRRIKIFLDDKHGSLYRIGGDEFTIILQSVDEREAQLIAGELSRQVAEQYTLLNFQVSVTTSIGISFFSGEESMEEMITQADRAMYLAKRKGKDTYVLYSKRLEQALVR